MHANYVCMYVYFRNGIAALPKYILSKLMIHDGKLQKYLFNAACQ